MHIALIEDTVGLMPVRETVTLEPHLLPDWHWLRVHDVPYRRHRLCFFLARQADVLRVHTLDVGAEPQRAAIRLEAHGCALMDEQDDLHRPADRSDDKTCAGAGGVGATELKYAVRHEMMQNPARETWTLRHNLRERALPICQQGSLLPGIGVGGSSMHWM